MKCFPHYLKPSRVQAWGRGMSVLLCLLMVIGASAQTPDAPGGKPPQTPLSVTLEVLCNGDVLHDGDALRTPAHLFFLVYPTTTIAAHKGDSVTIDFFANTNKLGSQKCVWHEGIRPDPHSRKFQPMIIVAPGFGGVSFDWTNAPAGSYKLTARASGLHGLSAVTTPLHITILAPSGP